MLRGLFDAHCALNEVAEEAELGNVGRQRVDGCIQLTRCMAPCRLDEFFRSKVQESSEDGEAAEVAPGKTLRELVADLGRTPGSQDLMTDPDAATQPSTVELMGIFSKTTNHMGGAFMAEIAKWTLESLEITDESSGGATYAEYRLPLIPETGACFDLARWASDFDIQSERAQWVLQLSQSAYGLLKTHRSVLNFGELLENVFGPPVAAVNARDSDASKTKEGQLRGLLHATSGFELANLPSASEDFQSSDLEKNPWEWTMLTNPPFFYQLYQVWLRIKVLNMCREEASLPPFSLRCASHRAEHLACSYLLGASGTTRCSCLGTHAPLQYLFALELDALIVSVSLASKRSLAMENGQKIFSNLFRSGVTIVLCTEDPTMSQKTDNPLDIEYALARNSVGCREADLAEIARNSMLTSGFRQFVPRGGEDERSIRERYRHGRRDAELRHIQNLAQLAGRSD
jgi:AMP deaminase